MNVFKKLYDKWDGIKHATLKWAVAVAVVTIVLGGLWRLGVALFG